jgi:hypothetical protein
MTHATHAVGDEPLVRVGWVEVFMKRDGTLIGVPSLSAHDAPRYLKVTDESRHKLTVSVERSRPL